jgi:hypothetical protein
MSKIAYQIGEGKFSEVMVRIASILTIEFAGQINLGNTFLPSVINYDTENSVNEGDIPFVSVNWLKFDNQDDYRQVQSNMNKFFIDVKAKGYDTVRKIIAVIRTILKSEQYLTLDYDLGFISETNIISAGVSFEDMNRDSQGVISGGLTYQCLINEDNDSPVSTNLNETYYNLIIKDKTITLTNIY